MDIDATVDLDYRASNDDPPCLILVVIMRTPAVSVAPTAVLLGLAGRQTAVSPTGLLPAVPARWALVAVTIGSVFVSVAAFPALIVVIIEMLVSMLVLMTLVPVICHHRWDAQAQGSDKCEDCQLTFAHVSSTVSGAKSVQPRATAA